MTIFANSSARIWLVYKLMVCTHESSIASFILNENVTFYPLRVDFIRNSCCKLCLFFQLLTFKENTILWRAILASERETSYCLNSRSLLVNESYKTYNLDVGIIPWKIQVIFLSVVVVLRCYEGFRNYPLTLVFHYVTVLWKFILGLSFMLRQSYDLLNLFEGHPVWLILWRTHYSFYCIEWATFRNIQFFY